MIVGIDTNILAYAEGANAGVMQGQAVRLLKSLPQESVVLPVQVLGELFNVLVKKEKQKPSRARELVLAWRDTYRLVSTSPEVLLQAADLASDHGLSIWDSVVIAASADAGCRLLLSEDLHEGFTWRGVTVTNPFAPTPHPLLAALLTS